MTKLQRDAFIAWAENEAHGAVNAEGSAKAEFDHRIRAGFDAMRKVFPDDEDWLGTIWESLMH